MIYAIVSDIHSNLEALTAVLAAIDAMPVDAIYCLGDLVGYNADPDACVGVVLRRVAAVVRGNHDKAVAGFLNLDWFNASARQAAEWTRGAVTPETLARVRSFPEGPLARDGGILLCHGTPYDEDAYLLDRGSVAESFRCLDEKFPEARFCLHGHTHVPLVVERRKGESPRVITGQERVALEPGATYLINPGSVGQPRDGNALASFGILDTGAAAWSNRRVAYGLRETQRKIIDAGLPAGLARRLAEGR